MKKLLAALLVLAMMLMGVAALAEGDGYELALVTDVGNIDDQSFNQSSYEGMVAYAEENGLTYAYYRPSEDSDEARLEQIHNAVSNGAKVVILPGYLFAASAGEAQTTYPDVDFIVLDIVCLQVAFALAYVARHGWRDPYRVPLYRGMAEA